MVKSGAEEPAVDIQLLRVDLSSFMITTNMYVHVKYSMKVHTDSSEFIASTVTDLSKCYEKRLTFPYLG